MPLIATNLLQASYSLIDLAVVGQYMGRDALSGINNGSQIIAVLTQVIIGLTTGGGILVAQAFGRQDVQRYKRLNVALHSLTILLGGLTAALIFFFSGPILRLIDAPAFSEAHTYLRTCSVGLFFVFVYNGLAAVIRSMGNSRFPLYCILVTVSANLVLDLLFIAVFRMGVFGAALATVCSQGLSCLFCLSFCLAHPHVYGIRFLRLAFPPELIREILAIGIPLAFQMSIAALSWLAMTYLINQHDVVYSAANGFSAKIKDLIQTILMATADASAAMVAQNIGVGQIRRVEQIVSTAMKIALGIAALLLCVVELFAPLFCSFFSSDREVVRIAALNLRIEIIGQLFYAVFLVYHSLAIGTGYTLFVMFSSFTNCILVRVTLAFLLHIVWGAVGVYIACMIAPSASIPLGIWFARSQRWHTPKARGLPRKKE